MFSEPITLARAIQKDYRDARDRYYAALREALPVGTLIRFSAHNGKYYDGEIAGPCRDTGFVKIRNHKTGREYEIGITYIKGL